MEFRVGDSVVIEESIRVVTKFWGLKGTIIKLGENVNYELYAVVFINSLGLVLKFRLTSIIKAELFHYII